MDKESVGRIIEATLWPRMMVATALGVLALFLLVATFSEIKSYSLIGAGVTASNTISVSGTGDVYAVPDIATFSATVEEKAKDVKTAQATATKRSNDIVAYLKQSKIDEKDIKTSGYNIAPQYDYVQAACPMGSYCPPGKQVLSGYIVSQTLDVKIRDIAKAGDILAGVGSREVSQVSGLTFTIDKEDDVKAQARDKAIAQAKEKAQKLASSLGVTLVRIVGFTEGSSGYPPVPMARGMMSAAADMKVASSPEIPAGQNKITSDVSITYEVR